MADTDAGTLGQAGELVKATGLDVSQWPPEQVRGLFIDVALIIVLGLALWRLDPKAIGLALIELAKGTVAARKSEADALKATAELDRAQADLAREQAEALGRIKTGRRHDD